MNTHAKFCLALLSVLVLFSGLAFSQSSTTGAIEGRVLDDQGAPLIYKIT